MTTTTVIESPLGAHHRNGGVLTAGITILLAAGVVYTGISLYNDLVSAPMQSVLPYILLGIALLIALGFEMCNGFHDTSNAVAPGW
jgi:PiT family inorganic phosphate transporter